jgi:hypothetical protein
VMDVSASLDVEARFRQPQPLLQCLSEEIGGFGGTHAAAAARDMGPAPGDPPRAPLKLSLLSRSRGQHV